MSNIDMNKNSENGSSNYTGDDKFVIKNLNLHYGDFHALKNINMNIPKNQITAFIGPSGCGKSTFLKTLNRMNDLIEGVKIDGEVYLDQYIYRDGRHNIKTQGWNGIPAA